MKDSKNYAEKIKKLQRALKRAYGKVPTVSYNDPVDALVYAMMSEPVTERKAQAAAKRVADYFVDLNDLRVSLPEEIAEIVGEDSEAVRDMALALSRTLTSVFSVHHTVSLMAPKKQGKRLAKQALEELEGITRFAVGFCTLTALQGHAVPLTGRLIALLKAEDYVHPDATDDDVESFVTKQIAAKDGWEFYMHLRAESESTARARKIKSKTVTKKKATKKVTKKAAKKTTKKAATKKTTTKKTTKKTPRKKTTKRART